MGTGIIIRGDQVNPDSTGDIMYRTMDTYKGVCIRGRGLSTRVLCTVRGTYVPIGM